MGWELSFDVMNPFIGNQTVLTGQAIRENELNTMTNSFRSVNAVLFISRTLLLAQYLRGVDSSWGLLLHVRTDDHGVFRSDLVSPEKQASLVLALLPATCLNFRSRLHFLGLLDYDQGGRWQQACGYDTALTLGAMKVNPPEILIC